MKCKILLGISLQETPLEDQINEFLADFSIKVEDVKLVSTPQAIYAFIFYTENKYLKPNNPLIKPKKGL